MPRPKAAETPYIQSRHLGATVARMIFSWFLRFLLAGRRSRLFFCVLAVRRRAWGPPFAYPPLMSYTFFTEALNEIGDSI